MLWTEIVLPWNSYVEALTSNMTIFGNRAFRVIRLNLSHKGGDLIQQETCVLIRRDSRDRGKAIWEYSKKVAVYKQWREDSTRNQPYGTLILKFWPHSLWEIIASLPKKIFTVQLSSIFPVLWIESLGILFCLCQWYFWVAGNLAPRPGYIRRKQTSSSPQPPKTKQNKRKP